MRHHVCGDIVNLYNMAEAEASPNQPERLPEMDANGGEGADEQQRQKGINGEGFELVFQDGLRSLCLNTLGARCERF